MRTRELGNAAGLLSRDFGFRAAVATGDPGTAHARRSTISRRGSASGSPSSSTWTAASPASPIRACTPDARGLWSALDDGQTSGVARLGGVPHHVVAAPIMAPNLVGWVVFASRARRRRRCAALEQLSAIPISARVLPRSAGQAGRADQRRGRARPLHRRADRATAPRPGSTSAGGTAIALAKPLRGMGEGESGGAGAALSAGAGDGALSAAAARDGADRPARADPRPASAPGGCR